MSVMVIVILIVLGLCFGSFVNALVWRIRAQAELAEQAEQTRQAELAKPAAPAKTKAKTTTLTKASSRQLTSQDLSITKGRSMCVHCHHPLAAKDLIPVISYLSLRGKCRYCRRPIQDTPLSELLTPALFVISYLLWPYTLAAGSYGLVVFCFWLVFLIGFVALTLYDIRWYELPHRIVLPLIGLAFIQLFVVCILYGDVSSRLIHAGLGALIGGGLFFGLYMVSPKQTLEDGVRISKWIGGGDITLGFLIGMLVGGPSGSLLMIFLASLLGTIVALPLLVSKRADRSSHLPFGPYLMAAAVITFLFGKSLIGWYTGLFLG